jgi:hypothetical protein
MQMTGRRLLEFAFFYEHSINFNICMGMKLVLSLLWEDLMVFGPKRKEVPGNWKFA